MTTKDIDKRLKGRFFTVANPFKHEAFLKWWKNIPESERKVVLEPFAGSNAIVAMLREIGIDVAWECYDIQPAQYNQASEFPIVERDSIESFPTGRSVAITNPPYLARNLATRRGIPYKYREFDDLYKKCLDVMLANCDYVSAIIPESFITAGIHHDRLKSVVSLPYRMFDDTECPVCLALFSPNDGNDDFSLFVGEEHVGTYKELSKRCDEILSSANEVEWSMNDACGTIGVRCVDDVRGENGIVFTNDFSEWKVSPSSRSYTIVSGLPDGKDASETIERANSILRSYRTATKDVFMTSFKGLRSDGRYRRRLDYRTVQRILNKATE